MNVAIAGTGYVGLITAACLAEFGHCVTCVDVDLVKIQKLSAGIVPIFEQGLNDLLIKNKQRLSFVTDGRECYKNADIIMIAVGTPEKSHGFVDLRYVFAVAEDILEARPQDALVVVKSTVPIGTNEKLERLFRDNSLPAEVVSNPEFLSQGTGVRDMLNGSRIVIGADSDRARKIMRQLYSGFDSRLIFTGRRSAEMIKYASNTFLAVKISYINEIANLCEKIGADIKEVSYGMGLDPRIGNKFLNAGVGFGGSCFPKDMSALCRLAENNDYELKIVESAIEVNKRQKLRLLKKSRKYYDDLGGLTVAVLGLAFKPGTDDVRDAPAMENIPLFINEGAHVKAWDPCAAEKARIIFPDIEYCETIGETLRGTDICFIFTEWDDVKMLSAESFSVMNSPIVIDGRNCLSFNECGFSYESVGRCDYLL